jgi:hypothetical protein
LISDYRNWKIAVITTTTTEGDMNIGSGGNCLQPVMRRIIVPGKCCIGHYSFSRIREVDLGSVWERGNPKGYRFA